MRIPHLILIFSLSLPLLCAGNLSAKGFWAVVARTKLDERITRQLNDLARQNQVEIRNFRSTRGAARQHPKLLIELSEEMKLNSFLRALKQEASHSAAQLTPELAREGYLLDTSYGRSSFPNRIHITAIAAAGFHHALLRVPAFLSIWPSNIATALSPPPKSANLIGSGRRTVVTLADFPSFPERGIVEGFYGVPWNHRDRLEMLRFEGQRSMNVYYYAPKDDPYHRKLWRKPYPPTEMKRLAELVKTAKANFVNFCFAISPGLSMVYSSDEDFGKLTLKLDSVGKLGISCFALFLDDVPQELQSPQDQARFKTLAAAHVHLINKLDRHLKSRSTKNRLTVTPTTYTNEWGSRDYIRELGAGVNLDVAIVWTGPKVISPAITVGQAKEWGQLLRRPPLVWDNFPVNDGISWRLNLGPLRGRDPNLPAAVRGLFSNPMNQARASMVPLQTAADYLWNSLAYDPERSHQKALSDQYGKEAAEALAPFLKTYGDYWWEENVFKPLFVEERKPVDIPEIERHITALESSLEPLRNRRGYQELVAELAPFPPRTRERLSTVREDPAFRLLSEQRLQWREDYDALSALRASETPKLDGDFTKWSDGPLYALNQASQIVQGSKHWKGANHFSGRVALAWDENYLYLGVDVTDPQLYQPFSGRGIDKGDVFFLTLETTFRKHFESTDADVDEYRLLFSPGNFSGVGPSLFSDEDYLPPRPSPRDYNHDIRTAWKKTPQGFSGDMAIPASYFEGGAFRTGYEIGLSFAAQKALPPRKPTADEEIERIVFTSKSDRVFPVKFDNPSSYQRLVLTDRRKP